MEQKPPEFKDLIGYEGLYQIHCETGDIYSIPRQGCAGGKRTPYIHNEYPTLILSKGNKSRHVLVHRIVAENLVPNPDPDRFQFVKHIDKNKLNYSPSNLKWDVLARKPKKKKAAQPPVNGEELAEELWDKYSYHVDDDIDSLQMVAGSSILRENSYKKLITELLAATPPASPAKAEQEGPWKSMEQEEPKYGMLRFVRGIILNPEPGITNGETVATINQFWDVSNYRPNTKRWNCEIYDSNKKVTHWMDIPSIQSTAESAPKEAGQPIESDGRTWYAWTELATPPVKEAGQVDSQFLDHFILFASEWGFYDNSTRLWEAFNEKEDPFRRTTPELYTLFLESLNKQP